ncbi:MAG TPA: hypothetical protein VGT79_01105, partial [Xanthomonadaceae bacterium]|nr:hypothetical protein [Xanthomonadaceae bacterium]
MKSRTMSFTAAIFFAVCGTAAVSHAADRSQDTIKRVVDRAIQPVMAQYGIPGMEVGVVVAGKPYVFSY